MNEFGKWYINSKYQLSNDTTRRYLYEAWQAATAESDKRIAELEAKYLAISDSFESENTDLQAFIRELSASVNVLREALASMVDMCITHIGSDYNAEIHTRYAKAKQVLATTPAQSLQSHDNEVIEKCAVRGRLAQLENKVVDIEIRALKGEQNAI